jgi:hypothetical protein
MGEKRGKGVIRSVGLGLLLATLVLVAASQSWASILLQSGTASIDLTKVTVNPVGGSVTDSFSAFPDITVPGFGYSTSSASNNGAALYASATVGVESATMSAADGLYVGSATASRSVAFTALSTGDINLSIDLSGFFLDSVLSPGPYAYSASSSAWLEIGNADTLVSNRISLADGVFNVSFPFIVNDNGFYRIEVFADASAQTVPEPSTTVLIGIGLAVVAFARKKMVTRN